MSLENTLCVFHGEKKMNTFKDAEQSLLAQEELENICMYFTK